VVREEGVPVDGTVVEIGPGFAAKIGFGLAGLGFRGTVLLVEPDSAAREWAAPRYRELLAAAEVVARPEPVPESGYLARRDVDLLAGNHVLDDLLLAAALPAADSARMFTAMRPGNDCSEAFIGAWRRLLLDPDRLARAVRRVVDDLTGYVRAGRPGLVLLNQYPSWRHDGCGLGAIHETSLELLRQLGAELGATAVRCRPEGTMAWLTARGPRTLEG
jgi:hypothetical protein